MDLARSAHDLATLGVRHAFGIPGGGPSLTLITEMQRAGIRFHTTGHEAVAALAAGAASRVSGAPSVAISIKGPGLANLLPGLLCNRYEGFPCISISEAYPHGPAGPRRHKALDHESLLRPLLRGHFTLTGAPNELQNSWACASAETPGPVHFELAPGYGSPAAPIVSEEPTDRSWIASLATALNPVLIVGSLALRSPWRTALAKLKIPVFTTAAAKGALDETSPWAAGVFTGDGKPLTPEKRIAPLADCAILIGVPLGELLNPAPPAPQILSIDLAGSDDLHGPCAAHGRIPATHEQIASAIDALSRLEWGADETAAAKKALFEALPDERWNVASAMRICSRQCPDAIHVLDTGNFTVIGEHCLDATPANLVIGTPNGRTMGAGIGYALGAAIAAAPRKTVLWIGDGGIRAHFAELAIAAEENLPLTVMVMRDGYFGSIRPRALSAGLAIEPLRMQERGLIEAASAFGFDVFTARSASDLASALTKPGTPRPALFECSFDPDDYMRAAALLR